IIGKIGGIDVTSVSAYRYSMAIGRNELDGTPVQILASESYYKSSQYSQELRFSGDIGDRLSYIFGGYYSTEKGVESSLAQTFRFFAPAAPAPNFGFTQNLSDVKNRSAGIFGQANYNITDALRLTGGLRWTWDKRSVVLHNITNVFANTCSAEITGLPGFIAPCSYPRSADFDYPAWTLGLDYRASDDLFVYLKTSAAAKAGGFNIRNGSASTPPFNPEKVKDVEGGLKMTSPDGRLRANVALFYSWQSGVQRNAAALVNVGGVTTTTQFLLNAGKQDVYGAEFEVSAVPWEGMLVNANLSLLNGEYVDGSFTEVRDLPGAGLPGCTAVPTNPALSRCIVDRSGETVPQLPKVQLNFGLTQKVPVSFGEFTLHGNYAYISKQAFDTQTADPRQSAATQAILREQNDLGVVPAYGLFDGRLSLQLDEPNIELFTFAKNIGGKKYVARRFNSLYSSLGVAFQYIGSPFTWGAGVTFRFGPR
ncbi:TonB-dependent receptor, partial [Sphingomonas sp. KC8]|uniref:TonB-dependent receptor n=1 Tax=Sphingomonas sp. KC8 TaxID=1030157 RepID=UPI000248BBC7